MGAFSCRGAASFNKRMQSDKLLRYAPQFAADARRYRAEESSAYLAGWKSPLGKG